MPSEWKPIATAPADQTVDLYMDWAKLRETDCHWDGNRWVHWHDEGDGPEWNEVPEPSHWMPLPEPPKESHE